MSSVPAVLTCELWSAPQAPQVQLPASSWALTQRVTLTSLPLSFPKGLDPPVPTATGAVPLCLCGAHKVKALLTSWASLGPKMLLPLLSVPYRPRSGWVHGLESRSILGHWNFHIAWHFQSCSVNDGCYKQVSSHTWHFLPRIHSGHYMSYRAPGGSGPGVSVSDSDQCCPKSSAWEYPGTLPESVQG